MTLGARMTRRDEAAFVGRKRELGFVDSLFVDDPPANVVLVHGPGGIGKSTLLRHVQRRGEAAGWTPVLVEARDLPPVPDALHDALAAARDVERPLVLIDSYERMAALGGYLRRAVLPELPDATIVVIAGRRAPEPGWSRGRLGGPDGGARARAAVGAGVGRAAGGAGRGRRGAGRGAGRLGRGLAARAHARGRRRRRGPRLVARRARPSRRRSCAR